MRLRNTLLASFILLFSSLWAHGQSRDSLPFLNKTAPAVRNKHFLPEAIQVEVTPHGLKYFETNLEGLLGVLGYNIRQGQIPELNWQSERSYRIDDIQLPAAQRELLTTISNLLNKWLIGFSFKEFRPSVQIGQLNYVAHFNRFAMVADPQLLRKLGYKTGAIMAIEMELSDLTASAESVRASDQNNQFLGAVGADQVSVTVGSKERPIKLRLPFYINVNSTGVLSFKAIDLENNFDQIDLDVKYRQLVVPEIAIEINGHRFEMSKKQLETEAADQLPELLVQVRGFLKQFASKQLPALLNQKALEILGEPIEEITLMKPVGSVAELPPHLQQIWGMRTSKIDLNRSLAIKLDAFVEDPLLPNSKPDPKAMARKSGWYSSMPPDQYDLSIAIDRGLMNRMTQLSFERQLFQNMPISAKDPQGPKMDLMLSPDFDYIPQPVGAPAGNNVTYAKVHTRVNIHKGYLKGLAEKLALVEPFEVEMDIVSQIRKTDQGEIRLYYYDVVDSSIVIDDKYLDFLGKIAPGTVRKKAAAGIKAMFLERRNNKDQLCEGALPIPSELGGIPLNIRKLGFDPSGRLTVYMTFAAPQK